MSDLGDLLRRARAHKGVTLRDAERKTRISRHYLAALEAHDFEQLPPRAYARGIVRNYAHYLGLDPGVVLGLYEQAASGVEAEREELEVVPAVQPIEIHGHWAPNFAIITFMLVVSAIIFTWIYSAYLQPSEEALPTTISQATATPVEESLLDLVAQTPTGDETDQSTVSPATSETTAPAEAATPTPPPTPTPEPVVEPTPTLATEIEPPTVGPEILPPDIAIPPGYHLFAVYAEEEVWVEVWLDGSDIPALNVVLPAGTTETFLAQTATITSGNAAFVRVYVDGEDWGTLGEPWDAVVTYPY